MREAIEQFAARTHHRVVRFRGPSFHHELCRLHRIYEDLRPDESPLFWWETKTGGRRFAASVGIETVPILQGPVPSAAIEWEKLPEWFVVKPNWGEASRGVFVLSRDGSQFQDKLTGRTVTEEAIVKALSGSGPVIVEERLGEGQVPHDWKLFCFFGEVELILQICRTPKGRQYRYYTRDWADAGNALLGRAVDPDLPPPGCPQELKDAAHALSVAVDLPFVRVDLFEHDGGVVFGELTPRPWFGFRFVQKWDERLGSAWEAAIARRQRTRSAVAAPTDFPDYW